MESSGEGGGVILSCQKTGAEKVELAQLRWASGAADVSRSSRVAHSVPVGAHWPIRAGI